MKSFRLIPLGEEISKQPNIDSVMWLLVVTVTKVYNEKKQAQQGQLHNVKFKEKGVPRCRMILSPVFKEINRLRNEVKRMVTSGQDSTQLSFQLVERS